MSIDNRCREQQSIAQQMVMDFNSTDPGSHEQLRALKTLTFLVGMWSDFLSKERQRMDAAISLGATT